MTRYGTPGGVVPGNAGRDRTLNHAPVPRPATGTPLPCGSRFHARQARQPFNRAVHELDARRRLRVGEAADADAERQQTLDRESGVDALQRDEAVNQQARAGEEHHGNRDFGDHECAAHPRRRPRNPLAFP